MQELKSTLAILRERISTIMVRLDLAAKEKEAARLEAETTEPGFWDNQSRAQAAMRQLADLRETIDLWHSMEKRAGELSDLLDLAVAEQDQSLESDISEGVARLKADLDKHEFQLLMAGPYDRRNAILAVHAGAGGTDSQDWAQILLRMFLQWAEHRRYDTEVLDMSSGEEAGVKSATVLIKGAYAYGYLKSERGVHRLVRISPFDASKSRHTSFALVEVMPEAEAEVEVAISPDDLKWDFFRASGAGGQNVQKTSTAVRLTHLSSGLVVTCQNERSQIQNKETALRILKARLMQLEMEKRAEMQAKIKGQHVSAGWSNQIRSYVLHPYKMVKDHRTGYETSGAEAVLNGDLDGFMEAFLKANLGAA
ncbi:MAG: peptide chain release factor 2 [Dehalococcoidia bacterium]|nr:peptide chain release factor 2 [Dehalococcoidia bacterium]